MDLDLTVYRYSKFSYNPSGLHIYNVPRASYDFLRRSSYKHKTKRQLRAYVRPAFNVSVTQWWRAQLAHYGLEDAKNIRAAKSSFRHALSFNGRLRVPKHFRGAEAEMKAEFEERERAAVLRMLEGDHLHSEDGTEENDAAVSDLQEEEGSETTQATSEMNDEMVALAGEDEEEETHEPVDNTDEEGIFSTEEEDRERLVRDQLQKFEDEREWVQALQDHALRMQRGKRDTQEALRDDASRIDRGGNTEHLKTIEALRNELRENARGLGNVVECTILAFGELVQQLYPNAEVDFISVIGHKFAHQFEALAKRRGLL